MTIFKILHTQINIKSVFKVPIPNAYIYNLILFLLSKKLF